MEIYDNKAYDLLCENTQQLTLIEDPIKGLMIPRLNKIKAEND